MFVCLIYTHWTRETDLDAQAIRCILCIYPKNISSFAGCYSQDLNGVVSYRYKHLFLFLLLSLLPPYNNSFDVSLPCVTCSLLSSGAESRAAFVVFCKSSIVSFMPLSL